MRKWERREGGCGKRTRKMMEDVISLKRLNLTILEWPKIKTNLHGDTFDDRFRVKRKKGIYSVNNALPQEWSFALNDGRNEIFVAFIRFHSFIADRGGSKKKGMNYVDVSARISDHLCRITAVTGEKGSRSDRSFGFIRACEFETLSSCAKKIGDCFDELRIVVVPC